MRTIEFAEAKVAEEVEQQKLGADNDGIIRYWAAYLDGAKDQKRETDTLQKNAVTKIFDETEGLCLCIKDYVKKMSDLVTDANGKI